MSQEELKKQVTIVIPTHYRHHLLRRILDYYKDCGIRILVADSSLDEFKEKDKFECEYFHYPDVPYVKKMAIILKKVQTPYVVFCADDDFVIVSSILKCVEFLNKHDEYSAVEGKYIKFYEKTFRVVPCIFNIYPITDCSEVDICKRVYLLFSQDVNCYYGVHRCSHIIDAFNLAVEYNIDDLALFEMLLLFCVFFGGGYKQQPFLHGVRGDVERVFPTAIVTFDKVPKHKYRVFETAVIEYLGEKHNMSKGAAKKLLVDSIAACSKAHLAKPNSWRDLVRRASKVFLSNKIYRKLQRAQLNCLVVFGKIKMRKELGYPFGADQQAKADWEYIKQHVKKHTQDYFS